MIKAVILAGGKGERISKLFPDITKPMIPLGDKPLLQHQIEELKRNNITDIIITCGYKATQIESYFLNNPISDVNLSFIVEDSPLGTGGCLFQLKDKLKEDFIVLNGDMLFYLDLDKLIKFHKSQKNAATLLVHPNNHPLDSDLLKTDINLKVKAILNRPHSKELIYQNLVNAGIMIFSPKIFSYIPGPVKLNLEKDILTKMLSSGESIFAYRSYEYIMDMGTPERYKKVIKDFNKNIHRKLSANHKQKAIFLDRDGVLNVQKGLIYKHDDIELLPDVSKALRKINESPYLAVVITNQSVIARNLCTFDELHLIFAKLETLLGNEGAYLDNIYFCPHHPDTGYPEELPEYKIKCQCRKPNILLFEKAATEMNIDFKSSYMVGDRETDILAAKNAGLKSVLIKTANLSQDKIEKISPDYLCQNLLEAVETIGI